LGIIGFVSMSVRNTEEKHDLRNSQFCLLWIIIERLEGFQDVDKLPADLNLSLHIPGRYHVENPCYLMVDVGIGRLFMALRFKSLGL